MKKYVVYFDNYNGCFEEGVFDTKEEAEAYMAIDIDMLSEEEDYFLVEEER